MRSYLAPLFAAPGNRWIEIDAGHAVQFERADELATAVLDFIGEQGTAGRR